MALEKGTEEWMFWSDFFQLCRKYWTVKDDGAYWKMLAKESHELYSKYKADYAETFIMAFIKMQEQRAKK